MMKNTLRTFIALPVGAVPEITRLSDRLRRALGNERINWVRPELLHLTLAFLGEAEKSRVEELSLRLNEAFRGVMAGGADIAGPGFFGSRKEPRVLWLGIRNDDLVRKLWENTVRVVRPLFPETGDIRYSPHLTIARIKMLHDPSAFHTVLEREQTDRVVFRLNIDRVVIYRSDLQPAGPVYSPEHVIRLG